MSHTGLTAESHHHHRDVSGGWLRPAVFGVMDGLVSNAALIAGVVGAGAGKEAVIITGLAGLVAGGCSMATGEYVSVSAQSDLARAEIARERAELARNPQGEMRELVGVLRSRGLSADLASEVATELGADPDILWRVHVREELGIDPDDLPSPWTAGAASFIAFAVGAALPVAPYMLGAGGQLAALVVFALVLLVIGACVAHITARPKPWGAMRQLLLGAGSASATFAIGKLLDVSIT